MKRLIAIIVVAMCSISAFSQEYETTLKKISEAAWDDLDNLDSKGSFNYSRRYLVTAYFVETINLDSLVFLIEDDGYIIPVQLQKNDLNATSRFLARNLQKGDFLSVLGTINEILIEKQKYRGLIDAVIVDDDDYKVVAQGMANVHVKGRSVLGSLPKPTYNSLAEGVVVVQIKVDQYGTVTEATPGADGTTVNDKTLWNAARSAALKAHFNQNINAHALQTGTITYIFKLK